MPIKPDNRKLYPKDWKMVRRAILARAENACEVCGVENYAEGGWSPETDEWIEADQLIAMHGYCEVDPDAPKIIRIVLTIAHLNHDPTDNGEDNLEAMCQRCHNRHDVGHRAESRRKTLNDKRGQMDFLA